MTTTAEAECVSPSPAGRPRRAAGRIVAGVDGSAGSLAALRWAAAEADRRLAGLRIVFAREEPESDTACHAGPLAASAAAAVAMQDALDLVVGMHGRLGSVSCVMPAGEPGKVLVEQASGAQMLVLGAVSGAGPGITARYCLRFARCSLVFVPA